MFKSSFNKKGYRANLQKQEQTSKSSQACGQATTTVAACKPEPTQRILGKAIPYSQEHNTLQRNLTAKTLSYFSIRAAQVFEQDMYLYITVPYWKKFVTLLVNIASHWVRNPKKR